MNFLLDTNVFLWLLAGSERVDEQTRSTLADRRNGVLVSVVCGWEITIRNADAPLERDEVSVIPC